MSHLIEIEVSGWAKNSAQVGPLGSSNKKIETYSNNFDRINHDMRNRYPGVCYICQALVRKGEGHFERSKGSWRLQCAIHPLAKHENTISARTITEAQELHKSGFEPIAFVRSRSKLINIVYQRTLCPQTN